MKKQNLDCNFGLESIRDESEIMILSEHRVC